MTDIYNKKPSLFVAWFNIFLCIVLPMIAAVRLYQDYINRPESFPYILPDVLIGNACFIPLLIGSILLVKGIKENRPKIIGVWIFLCGLQAALCLGEAIYLLIIVTIHFDDLETAILGALPYFVASVIWVLCIIPVGRLYKRMTMPPPVQSTQVVNTPQGSKEEEQARYMPVFENV